MKKSKKVRVVSYTLAAALSLSAASVLLSACGNQSRDNESTPLTLASDMFDSVFNPFFYTSGRERPACGRRGRALRRPGVQHCDDGQQG